MKQLKDAVALMCALSIGEEIIPPQPRNIIISPTLLNDEPCMGTSVIDSQARGVSTACKKQACCIDDHVASCQHIQPIL